MSEIAHLRLHVSERGNGTRCLIDFTPHKLLSGQKITCRVCSTFVRVSRKIERKYFRYLRHHIEINDKA